MKRKLDQAIDHVDKIDDALMTLAEYYATDHPEIVEQYKTVYAFFEQGRALLIGLRTSY